MLAKKDSFDQQDHRPETEREPSLRGTFASVMLLATVVIAAWVGVFLLFISRS